MKKYLQYITERNISQNGYIKEQESLLYDDVWFDSVEGGDIKTIEEYINLGFDINTQNDKKDTALIITSSLEITKLLLKQPNIDVNIQGEYGLTALIAASKFSIKTNKYYEIIIELLKHPKIDVTIKNNNYNFIDYLGKNIYFLRRYDYQKVIIDNGRDDILLFLDKYGVVNPKIKEDHPVLFQAKSWGLIS